MVEVTQQYERTIEAAGAAAAKGDADSIAQAETLYRKALTAGERAVGPFDLSLLPALTGLGAVLLQRATVDEAVPMLTRAVGIAEQQLGADHPDVVILLNDVSRLYLRHAAHAHAEPLLQRLLEIKRGKGEDHPEVATVLASIASVRQTLGRHDEAEQLWRRVLEIRERTLAPNHIATASALEHLGLSCAARGKLHEALQLLQRALSMREITLGAEHPSLRNVRERIADLQLQASDDLFDAMDVPAALPARPRLSVAPHIASPLTAASRPAPAAVSPAPVRVAPQSVVQPAADPLEGAHLIDGEAAASSLMVPPASALSIPEPAQAPAHAAVPYLNVLMDIKDELTEEETEPASPGSWAGMMEGVRTGFRQRRAAAIGAAAGILALPVIGLGVASAMRDSRSDGWVESSAFAAAPTRDTVLTRAAAPEILRPVAATNETQKDSVSPSATPAQPTRSRTADTRSALARPVQNESEISIALQRPAVGRLDSVARSISVPTQNIGSSFEVQLQSSLASAQRSTAAALEPAVPARRAQLIGVPPVPRYPDQLAQSRIGGEVRVRFDVDTLGRPVLTTFAAVTSPHPALTESVRRALPEMRFEPARTPGPASRTVTETVEMSFQFNPRGN